MPDTYDYDVLVIGAGPGGYVAAIRAAQLGLKTACAEGRETLGGTCLNVGCIPSKAMLHASEYFDAAANGTMAKMGIVVEPKLDLETMHAQRREAVTQLTGGIEFLFKKNKVDWKKGLATFVDPHTVTVGGETVTAKNVIIATGSSVTPLKGVEVDNAKQVVVDSTGALELASVPKRMVVIGGGVIGLELGSVWRRLGAEVAVVEFLDQLLPGMAMDVRKEAAKIFKKQGMKLMLSTKVTGCNVKGKSASLTVEPAAGGEAQTLEADCVLVSIGRRPNTDGLGLDKIGLELNQRGQIETDHDFRTKVDGVWAIGDVIAGPMLAHKAEDEGIAVAEIIAGQAGHVNYGAVPAVVYTNPEIASVGKTEDELKAAGIDYKVGKFPFTANGRAKAMLATQGFVKILADVETDRVLGAHIIGKNASEMIEALTVLLEFGGSAEDLARTTAPHPTLSEAIREAALMCGDGAIHI